jgi:chromosome segregation protein
MPSRLKSLELQGYKTFANRTFFEFGETVTAIVGPNGSGKSNIADSLRWVLGEQSYSLLRARRTEDMIFSGSDTRSRAGLASATITFDNSDGWLPIDFTEVAITRRAHRDGQNEYLVNGQRVRLKDVSELLSESGLAERTYTVIGQGLVDAALSLKADERRRLFEEAAGIGLHRSRREESLHRLELTQRNLERVEDILTELKPRLHSLERQARRAQEFEQVRADLEVLLHEWYGFHWHETQKELAQSLQADRLQQKRLDDTRLDLEKIEAQLNSHRDGIQGLRENLNGWHKALSEHHAQREGAIRQLAMIEERKRSLTAQQESDRSVLANLDEELVYAEEQVVSASGEIERLVEESEEARQQAEAAQEHLLERQAERDSIERTIQSIRQEIGELNSQHGKLQARQVESENQQHRLLDLLTAADKVLKESEAGLKASQSQRQAAHNSMQLAEKDLQAAEKAIERQRKSTIECETRIVKLREQRASMAAQQARLKAELDVLEQAEAALTGYASGTRLILQASRENRLEGARGALSTFLQVPAQLERAIAAALGDFLDAVLLDIEPDSVMDLLESESGRGVLLPIKSLKPGPAVQRVVSAGIDVLGDAADLVEAPADLQPVVELLLRGVAVVKNRKTARSVLAGQPAGRRAVTLQGEVFYSSGAILTGTSESDFNLLARKRMRQESTISNQRLESQIEESDLQLISLKTEFEKLQADSHELEGVREQARQETMRLGRALDRASNDLEQAQRQMTWQQEQVERYRRESSRYSEERSQILVEMADLEAKLNSTRSALKQRESILSDVSLDDDQAQQAHWVTRQAVAERALEDAKSRLEERGAALERIQRTRTALSEKLAGWPRTLQEIEGQSLEAHQAEDRLGEAIRSLNEKIGPAEVELAALEEKQALEGKNAAAARQQVSVAEHFHSQARINLARKQENLQTLQRRIEDDFGLVNFEYEAQVSGQTPLPLMGMVEQLPQVHKLPADIEENIKRQRLQLRRMGSVNLEAQSEFEEVRARYGFLIEQVADLQKAESDIRKVILELDELMKNEFQRTFEAVAEEFRSIFTRLFGGGAARLILTDPDDLTLTGIEVEARLPGRRSQGLALLSGGERSLTATALVFALLRVSPTPFCVLDEVDAMLDEANVGRFRELLRELSQQTQFVIVTHNRNTVQVADVLYGVTMGKDSSSQVLSLKLDEVDKVID